MTPLKVLKAAVAEFEKRKLKYCLIGGHAASLYRTNERVTKDVDFALVAEPVNDSQKVATQVIKAIGFKPTLGFIAGNNRHQESGKICLITSTPIQGAFTGIIDILLPVLPWLVDAVNRAQSNRVDLGFEKVPVITPEDLIVAKAYAISDSPERFQDLDDIKEIFSGVSDLDLDYLKSKLQEHGLALPKMLRSSVPARIKKFCVENR